MKTLIAFVLLAQVALAQDISGGGAGGGSSAADASTTIKGVAKLSTAPAVADTPIAVGTNDTRLASAPFLPLAGGTVVGTVTITNSNPAIKIIDAPNFGSSFGSGQSLLELWMNPLSPSGGLSAGLLMRVKADGYGHTYLGFTSSFLHWQDDSNNTFFDASIDLSSHRINSVGSPSASDDAATKGYVDVCALDTVAINTSISDTHSGRVIVATADDLVLTLPTSSAGLRYTITQNTAGGSTGLTIAPQAGEQLIGGGISTPAASKTLINTQATSKPGDCIQIVGIGGGAWQITSVVGIWTREP